MIENSVKNRIEYNGYIKMAVSQGLKYGILTKQKSCSVFFGAMEKISFRFKRRVFFIHYINL